MTLDFGLWTLDCSAELCPSQLVALHRFVEGGPFLLQAFLLDLAQLRVGDVELFGDLLA